MEPVEIVEVCSKKVACDGGDGALGHPKVFLTIDDNCDYVDCPYCGRRFLFMHDNIEKDKNTNEN